MAWETQSTYYSGQGVVLLGDRDVVTGKGYGFIPVGNVSELKVSVKTSTIEHKESQSGARGIDLRLTTEINSTCSMKLDSFNPTNLATALRGAYSTVAGATVTAESNILYMGAVARLSKVGVSAVVARRGATVLTPYSTATAPWDYRVNSDAGSVMFNDGQGGALIDKLTTLGTALSTPFASVSGSKLTLTFAATPAGATVGKKAAVAVFTGADAAFVNSKAFVITAKTATTLELELGATGKTLVGAGTTLVTVDGDATIEFDYTSSQAVVVDALTQAATEKYLLFEGLNTANGNKAVIVEVFRFLTDPLKELSLISDKVQEYDLEGTVLLDALQTGSKYFRQTMLS